MGCLPVRGDNPRALASGLSDVQVDKHGITNLYHLHHCDKHKVGTQMRAQAIRCLLQKLSDLGLPCLSRPFGRQVEHLPQ